MKILTMMLALSMTGITAHAQADAPAGNDAQLAKVLGQLDAAAAKFQNASANFSWDQLTAVVQEHDVQTGTIAFRRGAKGTAMVAHVLMENGASHKKDVLFANGKLDLYQPEIHQETILDTGKSQDQFESFATLGFGGSGKDLEAQWNVTYLGTDILDGTQVTKLNLAPKHPTPDQMFTKIEIWIDALTATSRKQIFYSASGDNRTAVYSQVLENKTKDSEFKLNVPKNIVPIRK